MSTHLSSCPSNPPSQLLCKSQHAWSNSIPFATGHPPHPSSIHSQSPHFISLTYFLQLYPLSLAYFHLPNSIPLAHFHRSFPISTTNSHLLPPPLPPYSLLPPRDSRFLIPVFCCPFFLPSYARLGKRKNTRHTKLSHSRTRAQNQSHSVSWEHYFEDKTERQAAGACERFVHRSRVEKTP